MIASAPMLIRYVYKKLFTHEPIEFEDMCEAKSVTSALYLKYNDPDAEKTIIDPNTGKEMTVKVSDTPEFVGRVGNFCPIKPGCGGAELLRESKDKDGNVKYASATGAKGYFWLEAEAVKLLGKEDDIDRSYYDRLVDDAVETISQYGDFEWFVADDSTESVDQTQLEHPVDLDLPWLTACGKETCYGCPHLNADEFHFDCRLGHDISDFAAVHLSQDDYDAFSRR